MAKPKQVLFLLEKSPVFGGTGVKNHHLELVSTPPQFFAAPKFLDCRPILGYISGVKAMVKASESKQAKAALQPRPSPALNAAQRVNSQSGGQVADPAKKRTHSFLCSLRVLIHSAAKLSTKNL